MTRRDAAARFGGARPGQLLGPLELTVSAAANERYWAAAKIDHPARAAGTLYPPMAANLTILLFQSVAPRPLLHTAQRLVTHRIVRAPVAVIATGTVTDCFEKRGREYVIVEATVSHDGSPIWVSTATFTEVAP